MVDAEWLLKSHRELLGVEKALQRRIKQLKMDDNENDVIESMELGTIQEAGMPRAQSRFWRKSSERCGRTWNFMMSWLKAWIWKKDGSLRNITEKESP